MAELDAVEAELQALRRAADANALNACRDALEKLLRRLAPAQALELARQQVERRLPLFERQQPGVLWPRDFLESLRVADPSGEGGRQWPWEHDEFPGPGANTFTSGIDDLWQARRLQPDDPRRLELLVDAIAAAIMVDKLDAWGARNPERWAYWYESAMTGEADPERGEILLACSLDPESIRIKREAWHEVADRLTEALGLAGTVPRTL